MYNQGYLNETVIPLHIHSLVTTDPHYASPTHILKYQPLAFNPRFHQSPTHRHPSTNGISSLSPSRPSLQTPTTTGEHRPSCHLVGSFSAIVLRIPLKLTRYSF